MQNLQNYRFAKTHEWALDMGGGKVRVGISDHAQHELGDLVFVNLPLAGDAIKAGERLADVESVKAVSDVYSPVTGTVSAVNDAVSDDPSAINTDAYAAWLVELEGVSSLDGLMTADEYAAAVGEA